MTFILDRNETKFMEAFIQPSPERDALKQELINARNTLGALNALIVEVNNSRDHVAPLEELTPKRQNEMLRIQMLRSTLTERVTAARLDYFHALTAWASTVHAELTAIANEQVPAINEATSKAQKLQRESTRHRDADQADALEGQAQAALASADKAVRTRNQAIHYLQLIEGAFEAEVSTDLRNANANDADRKYAERHARSLQNAA